MKKKLFKYIKIFVSLTLILSLVAPSYASLSASDGAAFVTKAEFDSALADFNSRLTTFEAGINSKIDSQVTSYLDRNGIWSGSDQVHLLKNNVYDRKWKWNWSDTVNKELTCRTGNYGNFTFIAKQKTFLPVQALSLILADPDFFMNGLVGDFMLNPEVQVSKSGLMFVRHKFVAYGGEDAIWCGVGTGSPGSNWVCNAAVDLVISTPSGGRIVANLIDKTVASSDSALVTMPLQPDQTTRQTPYTTTYDENTWRRWIGQACGNGQMWNVGANPSLDQANVNTGRNLTLKGEVVGDSSSVQSWRSLQNFGPSGFEKIDQMFVKKGDTLDIKLVSRVNGTWLDGTFAYFYFANGTNNATPARTTLGRQGDYSIQNISVY